METVSCKITDNGNEDVKIKILVREKPSRSVIDDSEFVEVDDIEGPVDTERMTIKVQDKYDMVDNSSEISDRKAVREQIIPEADSDVENQSDTSADNSKGEQVSHSRTLTDSENEEAVQHERKKKLTKVKVKIEVEDSSYEIVNVQIKNEDDQSQSSSSTSTSYGHTKEEEDVQSTEWYRLCTQSQGGHDRGNER